MKKETIEIPLKKATYEELQQVICELQVENYDYKQRIKKSIKKLNSAINHFEDDYKDWVLKCTIKILRGNNEESKK